MFQGQKELEASKSSQKSDKYGKFFNKQTHQQSNTKPAETLYNDIKSLK